MARRFFRRCLRRVSRDLLKPTATAINSLILIALLAVFDTPVAVATFFVICLGMDLCLGRCIGMMICRTRWIGEPKLRQKLIYNASYAACFFVMLNSFSLAIVVGAAQIISVLITGRTTHGLLAGMNSERS